MRGWTQEISRAQVLGTCPRYHCLVVEPCSEHPWQPTHACPRCGSVSCVLCMHGPCACVQPPEEAPPWEEHAAFAGTAFEVLTRPRRLFASLSDGDVGLAWTFAALCCLLPRLVYGLLDGRGGPFLMLLRAAVAASVQAASATFFLGSLHYLFVLTFARAHANWRISARAAGYAQAITMVIGTLVASTMLVMPGLRESVVLRDAALLASATWYCIPLYFAGERLRMPKSRALLTAIATSFSIVLAVRALS